MSILNQRLLLPFFLFLFQSHIFSSTALSQTFPPSDFDPNLSQIIAFPGAEGFGKFTTGGRGGQVLKVTNLNDSGPGSLRAAIDTRGARIIVFEVSGNIKLKSFLKIRHGNITIAGQTAPGEGITIQDYSLEVGDVKNVIIRFIRSRHGDLANVEGDSFEAQRVSDMIIDHCSFTWGTDETCSLTDVQNTTIQNSIIAEGLNNSVHSKGRHGYGSIMGGNGFSLIHNLWAHFEIRMPSLASGSVPSLMELKNNVIYNWQSRSSNNGSKVSANLYANYYKPGPATKASGGHTPQNYLWPSGNSTNPYGKFYLESNKLEGRSTIESNQWAGVRLESTELTNTYLESLKNKDQNGNLVPFQTPLRLYNQNISADAAFLHILNNAGANLFRDEVDQRILNDVKNGTITAKGSKTGLLGIIDSQRDVGGWPLLKSLPAPLDTDQDGIPDAWELNNNLNPNKSNDREYNLSPYYTDIEVYINSLVVNVVRSQYPTTPFRVVPILPSNKSSNIAPIEVTFAWEPIVNSDTYQIQISKSSTFSSGNVTLSNLKNESIVYPKLDANSTYYWRIRAVQNGIEGSYSNTQTFKTNSLNAIPGSTILLQPSPNQEKVSVTPIFSWAKVPNSASYQIQVSTSSDFSVLLINQINITETFFNSQQLEEDKFYYWRVRARNLNGTGNYSQTSIFKTVSLSTPADVVVPIRPTNGVTVDPANIVLEWLPVSGAQSYRVQVSTNSSFSSSVVFQHGVLTNYLTLPQLHDNTEYYWRVIGINKYGLGQFPSHAWTFKTGLVKVINPTYGEESLVGHWAMEEGSGNILSDKSGNNNYGQIVNPSDIFWSNGKTGKAVNLTGNTDRYAVVSHNSTLQIPNGITIAAWVKTPVLQRGTILSKSAGNGFEFWLDSDGHLEFRLNRTNNGATYRIRSNFNYSTSLQKWIHIAATFDGTTIKIFVNGKEDQSKTFLPFTIGTTSGNLIIGALGTIQRYQGSLDEIKLYSKALTIQEINGLMSGQENMRIVESPTEKTNNKTNQERDEAMKNEIIDEDQDEKIGFRLYPNPATARIVVDGLWIENGSVEVQIHDLNGKVVMDSRMEVINEFLEIELNRLNIANGLYVLIIQDNHRREINKFIKK
jgi:hypothetical protein